MSSHIRRSVIVGCAAIFYFGAALSQVPTNEPTDRLTPLAGDCTENCTGLHYDILYDFGAAVGLWNETAMVGIPRQSRVAIFGLNAAQTWERRTTLEATDRQTGDGFGTSISFEKHKALIGANGAAYLFRRSSSGWIQSAKLLPDPGQPASQYGSVVSYSGFTAAVGAPSSTAPGSVYVYETDGAGQVVGTTLLTANDGFSGDQFGRHIAIQGNRLVVSGTSSSNGGTPTVYVFSRSGQTWVLDQPIFRPAGDTGRFGESVAIGDSRIYIGSPDSGPGHGAGTLQVFGRSAGWLLEQTLSSPPIGLPLTVINFGNAVVAGENYVAVGSTWGGQSGGDYRGHVFLYSRETTGLVPRSHGYFTGETAQLAISGPTLLAGFVQSKATPFTARGYASAFTLPSEACSLAIPLVIDGDPAEWVGVPKQAITPTTLVAGSASSLADSSAFFRAQWDSTNLYVLVEVRDDALRGTSSEIYLNDSVELYLDGGHEGSNTYDANDYQLTVDWRGVKGGINGENISYASAVSTSATGYVVEYSIPWATLWDQGTFPGMRRIGIDVAINDNDTGAASRDSQIVWHGDGTGWFDPSTFGEYELSYKRCAGVVAAACARSRSIVIDGGGSEWLPVAQQQISNTDAVIGHPTSANSHGSFRLQWDATNLYALVSVADDVVGSNLGAVYENDGVELYLDGLSERADTYDENDFQLTVDRNGAQGGVHSEAIQFQSAVAAPSTSFAVEYAVPWAALGVTPAAFSILGLDVAINDSDSVAPIRANQLVWKGNGDGWFDPSTFGRVILDAASCP